MINAQFINRGADRFNGADRRVVFGVGHKPPQRFATDPGSAGNQSPLPAQPIKLGAKNVGIHASIVGTFLSRVNGSNVSHLSRAVECNSGMEAAPRNKRPRAPKGPPGPLNAVLADNLRRMIAYEGKNPSSWAASHKADKKQVQRALGATNSPTLDTLAAIADACGMLPWQLLVPNLDPANPPVFTMTKTERELYSRVKKDFASLPSPPNGGS